MNINYSEEKLDKTKPAIFLAGPVERKNQDLIWRTECINLFEQYNFDGTLYVPVRRDGYVVDGNSNVIDWEMEAMETAKVVLFWIPRQFPDLLGLTSNVEFGRYLNSGKIVYGRPQDAYMMDYLDILYEKNYNEKPCENLEELVKRAISRIDK